MFKPVQPALKKHVMTSKNIFAGPEMEVAEEQALGDKCPTSVVLNNLILVAKILEDDVRDNMELRLVSRTFCDAYHANLRKTQRNLKIEYICLEDHYDSETLFATTDRIFINHYRFKISNLKNYFNFLKNTAKVKIHSIVVKGLWQLIPSIRLSLHESIRLSLIGNDRDSLKKLIGMNDICHKNCEDCVSIPEECVEYGPLQIESLQKSFTKPRVFEKLVVSDYLLDDIANICMESTKFKDDCLKAVRGFIPSNFSCKTLILKISENRKEWIDLEMNDGFQEESDHQPMPREVMEVMLKQWNVQSVELKFVHKHHREEHAGEWTRKDWFRKLCFLDHYTSIKESDPSLKIKEVLVDLTDSSECNAHLARSYMYGTRLNSYVQIPSKIRRVFLNEKLKIQFSHYITGDYGSISKVVDGIMELINTEGPRNSEVEITNLYLSWKNDIDYFDELSKQEPHLRPAVYEDFHISKLPNRIDISHKTLNEEDQSLVKKEWVGRRFQLINEKRNCTINWTMFENDRLLD
ncbi:unnamed protein product [Caenorhabditis brenneri]